MQDRAFGSLVKLLSLLVIPVFVCCAAPASGLDEFTIKRQPVFEFEGKPQVARRADKVTITFASKGFSGATVATEDPDGRIRRRLACGVLGKNAPPPFQETSLRQTIVWDGKDDQGTYIDDKNHITVRASLGLKLAESDEDETVREAAAEALKEIQGETEGE